MRAQKGREKELGRVLPLPPRQRSAAFRLQNPPSRLLFEPMNRPLSPLWSLRVANT